MLLEQFKEEMQTLWQMPALGRQGKYTIRGRGVFLQHRNEPALGQVFSHFP